MTWGARRSSCRTRGWGDFDSILSPTGGSRQRDSRRGGPRRGIIRRRPAALCYGDRGQVTIAVSLKLTQQGTFTARGAVSDRGLARGRQTRLGQPRPHDDHARQQDGTHQAARHPGLWEVEEHVERHLRVRPVQGPVGRRLEEAAGSRAPRKRRTAGFTRGRSGHRLRRPSHRRVATAARGSAPTSGRLRRSARRAHAHQPLGGRARRPCQPAEVEFLAHEFSGRYPLSDKGRFSITADGYTIAGRSRGRTRRGRSRSRPAAARSSRSTGRGVTPTEPPPSVSPGRYCGFTLTGSGVCLDATRDAWVTRVRFEVTLRCFEPGIDPFKDSSTSTRARAAAGPDVRRGLSDVPLGGGGSLRFSVSGKFDDAERRVTGTGGLSNVTVVRRTTYRCRNAVSSFTAARRVAAPTGH